MDYKYRLQLLEMSVLCALRASLRLGFTEWWTLRHFSASCARPLRCPRTVCPPFSCHGDSIPRGQCVQVALNVLEAFKRIPSSNDPLSRCKFFNIGMLFRIFVVCDSLVDGVGDVDIHAIKFILHSGTFTNGLINRRRLVLFSKLTLLLWEWTWLLLITVCLSVIEKQFIFLNVSWLLSENTRTCSSLQYVIWYAILYCILFLDLMYGLLKEYVHLHVFCFVLCGYFYHYLFLMHCSFL